MFTALKLLIPVMLLGVTMFTVGSCTSYIKHMITKGASAEERINQVVQINRENRAETVRLNAALQTSQAAVKRADVSIKQAQERGAAQTGQDRGYSARRGEKDMRRTIATFPPGLFLQPSLESSS